MAKNSFLVFSLLWYCIFVMIIRNFPRRYPRCTALICISIIVIIALFYAMSGGRVEDNNVSPTFDPLSAYRGDMFNVLVTGGAGFIGSHVVEFFENSPFCEKIIVLDNLHTGKKENLRGFKKVEFVEDTIENLSLYEELIKKHKVEYVFHLAALISVAESMEKPDDYLRINSLGTSKIMQLAEKSGYVKRLVFASSAAIYGSDPSVPKYETDYPACESYYAVNKLDGEYYARIVSQSAKRDFLAIALRFFNVFGERQDPNSAYAAVIPNFIQRACVEKKKMTIFGDGDQTRDFVYVKDIVNALVFMAFNKERDEVEVKKAIMVYNVGYEASTTVNSLADLVYASCSDKKTSRKNYITYEEGRKGDVRHSRASSKKLREEGWRPKYNFEKSLKNTIEWFLEQKN